MGAVSSSLQKHRLTGFQVNDDFILSVLKLQVHHIVLSVIQTEINEQIIHIDFTNSFKSKPI